MQTLDVFPAARCIRESFVPESPLPESPVRAHLESLVSELELARAAVVASVAALRHQNCEIDADIAHVLQRRVGDVIGLQIERTEALLADLR